MDVVAEDGDLQAQLRLHIVRFAALTAAELAELRQQPPRPAPPAPALAPAASPGDTSLWVQPPQAPGGSADALAVTVHRAVEVKGSDLGLYVQLRMGDEVLCWCPASP